MGQNESKGGQGVAVAPFENYQGPPLGPPPMSPPGLVTAQYNQSGGRVVALDDGEPFWDSEPPYLPQPQPLPRTARGNYAAPRGMPRRGPFGPPPDRSVVNAPGYAQQLREGMMVEAAQDAPWFRSPPPGATQRQYQPPSGNRQPNIKTVRTVIDGPRGYRPPGQAQSYQVQAQQQSYQVQPQSYQVQAQPQTQQAQQVLYYDPKTGALSSAAGHQTAAPTMPVACGTQSCAAPQVIGYQQPQVLGYQGQPQIAYQTQPQVAYQVQPQAVGFQQPQQVMYAYPQQQQQAQPIVVPGQLYTATGGVQQLG